jgi:hypothetical protein
LDPPGKDVHGHRDDQDNMLFGYVVARIAPGQRQENYLGHARSLQSSVLDDKPNKEDAHVRSRKARFVIERAICSEIRST